MSLAASPCVGQASGRQLRVCGEFCICIARGWPPFSGGEGVSFSRLCCKFAQKTKGNHQVRVQLTIQPLRPESVWHIPARAVMPELWDQLSLTFQSGLCLPPARHDPRNKGRQRGGHKPGCCRKPGSKPVRQRPAVTSTMPRPRWTVASTTVRVAAVTGTGR